ncbi:hypothetical protein ABEF95_007051 [Exophiala dermatitidis]
MASPPEIQSTLEELGVQDISGFDMSIDESAPAPEASKEDYKELSVLRTRKQYITSLKQRTTTPRTALFAQMYDNAVTKALRAHDQSTSHMEDDSTAYIQVFALDQWREYNRHLFSIPNTRMEELFEKVRLGREMELLARYRDYMAMFLGNSDRVAKMYHLQAHDKQSLNGYWKRIQKRLQSDQGKELSEAIARVCEILGVDCGATFWMIKNYPESCEKFHSDIEEGITAGQTQDVAITLHKDLTELDNIFPYDGSQPDGISTREDLRATILRIITRLFEWSDGREDQPRFWRLTEEGLAMQEKQLGPRPMSKILRYEAQEQAIYKKCMRKLAERAMSDLKSKKRKFRELDLREVKALRDLEWVEDPLGYMQQAEEMEQAAKRLRLQARQSIWTLLASNGLEDSEEE